MRFFHINSEHEQVTLISKVLVLLFPDDAHKVTHLHHIFIQHCMCQIVIRGGDGNWKYSGDGAQSGKQVGA